MNKIIFTPAKKTLVFLLVAILNVNSQTAFCAENTQIAGPSQRTTESMTEDVEIRAQILAKNRSILSAGISAKITELPFREGQSFTKGDLLLSFDCSMEEAEYKYSLAQQRKASATVKVNKQLDKLQSISILEVENGRSDLEMAKARVTLMRAKLKPCKEFAPFDGKIAELMVMPRQRLSIGEQIMTILDPSLLEVDLRVPSSWLTWIAVDQPFSLHIEDTDRTYNPRISMIGAHVDPISQTVKILGELERDGEFILPGMSGNAAFNRP